MNPLRLTYLDGVVDATDRIISEGDTVRVCEFHFESGRRVVDLRPDYEIQTRQQRLRERQRGEGTELGHFEAYWAYGETKKLFEWLEEDYEYRGAGVTSIHNRPEWDNLRPDPRIQNYIRLTGLSQYMTKTN